jgi:thiol-disulfide isomerase/thioredoxin
VVALSALTALSSLTLTGCGRDVPATVGSESIASADRGDPLSISGTTLDGAPLSLADLRGKVVVVNDWASWCGPCRDETPSIVHLADDVNPADVAVVGINVSDDATAARAFVTEFSMPYPSIVDADGSLLQTIPGVPPSALPSTVVLDRQGRVAARYIGPVDPAALRATVAQLAAA